MASPLADLERGRKNSIRLQNALKPLPVTCDLILDYSDRESTVSSDIHDPFTDDDDDDNEHDNVHRQPETDESLRVQYLKRRLSKSQIAANLTSNFTPEHHKAELSTRLTMNISLENYCTENLREFHVNAVEIEKDRDTEENFISLIRSVDLNEHAKGKQISKRSIIKKEKFHQQRKASRPAHIGVPSKLSKASKIHSANEPADTADKLYECIDSNALSGIWRMMKGNPKEREFRITGDDYNIFSENTFDWLIRTDIEWNEKEKCRNKCETWLQKENSGHK